MPTKWYTWAAAGAVGVAVVIGAVDWGARGDVAPACAAIPRGALWLPAEHMPAMPDLERQARRLNDSGQCVLEGSWGAQSGAFYITVQAPGSAPRHVRFTLDELKR